MNEDVNRLVVELEKQEGDRLPGTNRIFDESDFIEMKTMSSVSDVKAFALTKGLDAGKFNSATIATGLQDVEVEQDYGSLFNFGFDDEPDIIGGLPSDYTPRNPTATDFYKEGDQWNLFANLPTESIYQLQARLIQGGLLARGDFTPGDFDNKTLAAINIILARQNRIGVKAGEKDSAWNEALLLYQNEPLPAGATVEVYLPPDYAEVSTRVKNLFSESLGRQPKGYELKLLAEQFYADSNLKQEQQARLQELALGPTVEQLESGDISGADVQETATGMQEVSPTGRLYENFYSLIQKEKDRLQAKDDIQNTSRLMLGTILGTRG